MYFHQSESGTQQNKIHLLDVYKIYLTAQIIYATMLTEVSEFTGMKVYSDKGKFVGTVDDVIVDLDRQTVHGLYMKIRTHPLLRTVRQSPYHTGG
jgi:Uncharacterized conserved protein